MPLSTWKTKVELGHAQRPTWAVLENFLGPASQLLFPLTLVRGCVNELSVLGETTPTGLEGNGSFSRAKRPSQWRRTVQALESAGPRFKPSSVMWYLCGLGPITGSPSGLGAVSPHMGTTACPLQSYHKDWMGLCV